MEILKDFGVDPILLGAQIINFLLLFFILKKYLYKPVLEMLKKRENNIKQGIKQAEEARLLLEKTQKEESAVIKKAQVEAHKMLADAKAQSQETLKQTQEYAKIQSEKIILEARAQIAQETKEAEARITKNVSELAVKMLHKALSEMLSQKGQEEIMEKVIKQLKHKSN